MRCFDHLRREYRLLPLRISALAAKSAGSLEWEAILNLVKQLSDVILYNLPIFWRICKGYIDGKYHKVRTFQIDNVPSHPTNVFNEF
jgi:hypothetical protein